MKGIRIHVKMGAGDFEQSTFPTVFRSILTNLAQLYWLVPEHPFNSAYASCDSEREAVFEFASLVLEPKVIEKRFHLLHDNNIEMIGFRNPPSSAVVAKIMDSNCESNVVAGLANVYIYNLDGAFWEVYAHDEEMIVALRRSVSDGSVEAINLEN